MSGLSFSYDERTDVLTVEGIHYAGTLFRVFALAPVGTHVQIIERRDGDVVVKDVRAARVLEETIE